MKPEGMDQWREFFQGANASIFEILNHAISVAAKDHLEEFKLQRCQIVDKLYSSELNQCCCHNHNELPSNEKSSEACDTGANGSLHGNGNAGDDLLVIGGSKDSDEIDICPNDPQELNTNQPIKYSCNQLIKYSCNEAKKLTSDIDEEKQIICEVYRIKEVVQNEDKSERMLLDSLKRLQLMDFSFEILKNTEIGKPVNVLRKHKSSQIRQLARSLILAWRIKVDKWLEAKETIAGSEKHSVDFNPSGIDEEGGLPQPPLDSGAFLTPQFPTQISLSQSIGGLDNERNLQNSIKIKAICAKEKSKPANLPTEKNMLVMDDKQQPVKQESLFKPIEAKPSDIKTMPWNIKKQSSEPRISQGTELQGTKNTTLMRKENTTLMKKERRLKNQQEIKETWRKGDAENGRKQQDSNMKLTKLVNTIQLSKAVSYRNSDSVRAPADQQGKFTPQEKNTIRKKLKVAKRKREQDHQQLEKAKNQRTTQMTDVKDLPRPGVGPKNLNLKQKNQKWHQAKHRN